jgi:hypothetical protein
MQKIKIACTSGITLPLHEMSIYPGKLKKHSQLEIERVVESIVNDGFLFPIAVGKLDGKNYVIDGECTYYALQELKYRGYEIPAIPVFYVRCRNEETLKKLILIGTSTNHCVTIHSLKKFEENESVLKELAFNEGSLITFLDKDYFRTIFNKYKVLKLKVNKKTEVKNNDTLF